MSAASRIGQLSSRSTIPGFGGRRYHVSQPIDPEILHSLKVVGNLGYSPNNERIRENDCPYILNKQHLKKQDMSQQDSHIPQYYAKVGTLTRSRNSLPKFNDTSYANDYKGMFSGWYQIQ